MDTALPPTPSLEQLRKQAKDLLKLHKQGDAACCPVLRWLRQFGQASDGEILGARIALNEVQFALAMHYGFEGWNDLKAHVEFVQAGTDPPRLQRQGDRVVIRGLEHMDWGGSFWRRQDSLMACLAAVLRAAGERTAYEEVSGLSGAAFKLLLEQPDWGPRQALADTAFDCSRLALRAFGYAKESISLDPQENPGGVAQARLAAAASIDRGLPALYMDGEYSLIVGYRNQGRVLICQPYDGGKGYAEMEVPEGMFGPAWWVEVLRQAGPAPDRRAARIESLRTAVRLTRTPELGAGFGRFASGLAAYEAWIDGLVNDRGQAPSGMLHANAYSYAILLTNRAAAAEYLRSLAAELDAAAGPLGEAAERYQRVSDRLMAGRQCAAHPWEKSWTPENRKIQAGIMRQNLADEGVAISRIEQALSLLE